ncbi:MAG: hypothetical protein ACK4UJ_10135 [Leptonema sp. (in: bacteria)]
MDFGDNALICIKVDSSKKFQEYLGPYSRFGFFHPGPILFYFYGFLEFLVSPFNFFGSFHSKSSMYSYFQFLLNLLLLMSSYWLFPKEINKKLRILAIFVFLFFFENLDPKPLSNLFSIWGPYSIIIPFYVLLISSITLLYKSQYSLLPILFLMNSIVISNHLSGTLYAGVYTFIVLLFVFKKSQNKKSFFFWLGISFLIFLVSFLPPIIEFFLYYPEDNISKIFKITNSTQSLRKGKEVFLYFFELISIFFTSIPNAGLGIGIAFVLLIFFLYFKRKFSNEYLKVVLFLANLETGLVLIYIFKIPFDLLHYLNWFYVSVFVLYIFVIFNYLFLYLDKEIYKTILIILLGIGIALQIYIKSKIPKADFIKEHLVVEEIMKNFSFYQNHIYKIKWGYDDIHHQNWVLASGLILKLQEKEISTCVDSNWVFMFGRNFLCPNPSVEKPIHTIYLKKNTERFLEPLVKKEKNTVNLYFFDYLIFVQ